MKNYMKHLKKNTQQLQKQHEIINPQTNRNTNINVTRSEISQTQLNDRNVQVSMSNHLNTPVNMSGRSNKDKASQSLP